MGDDDVDDNVSDEGDGDKKEVLVVEAIGCAGDWADERNVNGCSLGMTGDLAGAGDLDWAEG